MEYSLAPIDAAVRPWRTATLVAATLAAFELALIVVLGVALLTEPLSRHARRAAAAKLVVPAARPSQGEQTKLTAGKPRLLRSDTRVLVLNGNGRTGAAGSQASVVRGHGYQVAAVGNAPRTDYTRTVVMYRGAYRPEAVRLAADLGVKIVGPLDGLRTGDLRGAHVAVVVGQ